MPYDPEKHRTSNINSNNSGSHFSPSTLTIKPKIALIDRKEKEVKHNGANGSNRIKKKYKVL